MKRLLVVLTMLICASAQAAFKHPGILHTSEDLERMPEPDWADFLGIRVRRIKLAPFEASAVAKLHLAVHTVMDR